MLYDFNKLVVSSQTKLFLQIAREMVISPQNARLGLTALTKRIGLVDRPDNPDGELIRYRVIMPFPPYSLSKDANMEVDITYFIVLFKLIILINYIYVFLHAVSGMTLM